MAAWAHLDRCARMRNTTQPQAGHESGMGRVPDVVLGQVTPQPVDNVQEAVIQGQQDVCDQGRDLWQNPTLHLQPGLVKYNGSFPSPILSLAMASEVSTQLKIPLPI